MLSPGKEIQKQNLDTISGLAEHYGLPRSGIKHISEAMALPDECGVGDVIVGNMESLASKSNKA